MSEKLIATIKKFQADFAVDLAPEALEKLSVYYELVRENNALLHLVAPATDEEFAVRHILESLTLLEFLPRGARFVDVGAGAGLPSIPCLIARADLGGVLIESKLKKGAFLQEAIEKCGLEDRASLINRQFEEISKPDVAFVTCRALDKFTQKLPKIIRWARGANFLFFGGNSLRDELAKNRIKFKEKLMPFSEQRYLFAGKI